MIHPTAIIDPSATLGANVSVGPYSVIGANVTIGADCEIGPHVVIKGPTTIGKRNRIFQFASIGEECQDKKYRGEPTQLHVGDDNVIRECVTMQRGTVQDEGLTRVGSRGLYMAYAHIAHDCRIGDDVIVANASQIAGHVHLGDYAILGGGTMVHQFCRIGTGSMTGAGTVVFKDIPAYVMAQGNPAKAYTMNFEGLKRRNYDAASLAALKRAYKTVYRQGITLQEAIDILARDTTPCVQTFHASLVASKRGIVR
ncbi:acyl-ACP--UDP-N-acetylglucosamine O-acyltransferase [Salinispirillum sp. LH 10-3-1]|uniref:Acyl-[acyl-carrier-protein]--UDP-N-acetylglucosamine O-acyltransferase n=1 Tax=Salinispirillum sp. LH 10-3-1 TaxID=2952525 RepID=A0AB38YJ43_9GAMM